ncbi:MAG: TIGR02281 family clan AA aspartic protease [Gammaproteobacteria bacterium]|nr:TIGR02281 family clan AA aspartic protease [Gammaproteobacteria bacterium]
MSEPDEQQATQRTGRWMLIFAWVAGLALLTLLFQDALESRFNPNAEPLVQQAADGRHEVVLQRNARGHYVASGSINRLPVTFLLDTGATDVALPEALAERLRLPRQGGGVSQTANGVVAVWQTTLDEVQLGAITLRDVRAAIVPSMGAGDPVLLGMSFLRQLEFTQRDGQLTLRL